MISIVIPVYNELTRIDAFQARLEAFAGEKEILFSDGFSTDGSYEKIRLPKIQKAKGRGAQLKAAAEEVHGEYLWFLHADSIPHPDSPEAIASSGADWGCFRLAFLSNRPMMKVVAFQSDQRVRFRRIVFGDQGMFIKRSLYTAIGGFRPIPLMEDYDISMRLKAAGHKPHLLSQKIHTDARMFERNGIWPTIFLMQKLQRAFRRGASAKELNRIYRRQS
ncbi:transferase 2, rSAM/selenodomain-associated [Aedoeadaptatus ivorii]|uniref:4,4'-diaponeurosporenoate glycosyltransferase n=1 Tax=Aedoeadaptatus ivorii TaxID=54006 RepID=A0A448V265_9FIRM|nr:TIGR04283 family arsenosugar biosynthesis glycosyltransferase [Peptoniphilus ivorii]VEJ35848.1 transferase 2, rSAM/selenodomain-associated [Peptoniphilus ivorii]